jgi:uncharacterized protein YjdB
MAATVNNDMVIYDRLAQTSYLERIQDILEVFNAASNGAIVLRNEAVQGDFDKSAFYRILGAIEHRDVNSTATADTKKISADERVGVKVPWKYGPYATTEEAFKRRLRDPAEFYTLVGQDLADAFLDGVIQHVFAALEAAIGSNSNMVATGSLATDGKKVLTRGMRLFGDRFQRIAIFGMDSATYFNIVDDAIDQKIFNEADVVIYGGMPGTMGKPVLVSDKIPSDTIFGLQTGAVQIVESQAPGFRSYNIDDQENLAVGYRGEGTFNMELLGYSWNTNASPAAPANPKLSEIGTAANWRKHFTSDKSTAGVIIDLT